MRKNPYQECPLYKTEHFLVRLVKESDAEDLLECYSDPQAARIFNSDNCTSDFVYKSVEEVQNCIKFWLLEYARQSFVRFSIVDKSRNKAIGTIEMFARNETIARYGVLGVLRLDLASTYETENLLSEILTLVDDHFFEDFDVDSIITKAIPEAKIRVAALASSGYQSVECTTIVPYDYYFIKS